MSGAEGRTQGDSVGRGGVSNRAGGGPASRGAAGVALRLSVLLGLCLALLEIAAILSQPGVSRATATDLLVLTSWLAFPYAVVVGLAGTLCATFLARARRFSHAGVFAGSGMTIVLTLWLRTLGRFGSSGTSRVVLEALIVLVALGAGLAFGMAAARLDSRIRGTGMPRAWTTRIGIVTLIIWAVWGGREFLALFDRSPQLAPLTDGRKVTNLPDQAPNVLLISIDTLRADHLSCYGYPQKTSPAIDELAREGVLFLQSASTSSFTLPSHASMLTGLFPSTHGATYQNRDPGSLVVRGMGRAYPTLGEILRDHGYDTAGFVSGPLLSHQFGFARGFDSYDDRYDRLQSARARLFSRTMLFRALAARGLFSGRDLDSQRTADEVNPLVDAWLAGRGNQSAPFFMFIHYWDPHGPYDPPPPLNQRPDGSTIVAEYDMDRLLSGQYTLTPEALADNLALYDGEIRYVDAHVGELMANLRRRGAYDNTVIILTSDHGESFGEHDHWEHSRVLYEDLLHVPFIMRLPAGRSGGTVVTDTIAQPTDILPSVLSLAGIPVPEGIQGRDLTSHLVGSGASEHDNTGDSLRSRGLAFAELDRNNDWPRRWRARYDRDLASVRTLRWKYIQSSTGYDELYDLPADPGETTNLAAAEAETLGALRGLLEAWRQSVQPGEEAGERGEIDEGLKENLRGLGYIQ